MKEKLLIYYLKKFTKLRRAPQFGGAPHKPVLLLSILELVEEKYIHSNKIFIFPLLLARFKDLWNLLVQTPHKSTFALPFFHLSRDGFWHLKSKPGFEIALSSSGSIRSFGNLKAAVEYAHFDPELYNLLFEGENLKLFKTALLEKYFTETKQEYFNRSGNSYLQTIETEILADDPEVYRRRIEILMATIPTEELEEEKFIRSGVFRDEVTKVYKSTCAISGFRIDSTENVSLIDACHIKPFSISNNDHITNGIALCPNLHRAFDRGLISISDKLKVLISNHFSEYDMNSYSIQQFEGKEIGLPDTEKYFPHPENLEYHRDVVFLR